jgi:hypothetical protein
MTDPFAPFPVTFRKGQQAKDPIQEVGVQAVCRRPADLPQSVERVPTPVPKRPRIPPVPGDDQRRELIDGIVIKELGL